MSDSVISPGILPETPVSMTLVDDMTSVFEPRFARGRTQRNVYADPRWRLKLRFRGMRDYDRARLRMAIAETRGKGLALRVSPYQVRRGSFPSTELLTQSTEFTSAAGYTLSSCTLTVADRMLRMRISQNNGTAAAFAQSASMGLTVGVPYAMRAAFMTPVNELNASGVYVGSTSEANDYGVGRRGLSTLGRVAESSTDYMAAVHYANPGHRAGDTVLIPYMSVSRCLLADVGANSLRYSNQLGNGASWTSSSVTITSNDAVSPYGHTSGDDLADKIADTAINAGHVIDQAISIASSAADVNFSIALKNGTRGWAFVQLLSSGGSVYTYINLATGTLGTQATAGTWSLREASVMDLGNGWYKVSVGGKKPSGDTTLTVRLGLASADNMSTYLGDGSYIYAWGATLCGQRLASQLVTTTSDTIGYSTQNAGYLAVRGAPASTTGLLLSGDFIEIAGELKQVVAPFDSNSDGTGVISFRPGLGNAVTDNRTPVIVHNPMGRFMMIGDSDVSTMFGMYDEVPLDLLEVYE